MVVAVHDQARFLRQALDSALAQRGVGERLEVIVVDDGSTDDTWQVLESYGERIRAVRQANEGPGSARNRGAELATGEWIAFLDSDDVWHPEKIRRQLELVGTDPAVDLIYTDRFDFGERVPAQRRLSDRELLHEGDVFEPLLVFNFITLSSVLIRRSVFEDLGGFDVDPALAGAEDWDLWLRHAERWRVRLCPDALTFYRRHPNGLSNDAGRMSLGRMQVLQRALARVESGGGGTRRDVPRATRRKALAEGWRYSAHLVAPHHRWRALGGYLRAIGYAPGRLEAWKGVLRCVPGLVEGKESVERRLGTRLFPVSAPATADVVSPAQRKAPLRRERPASSPAGPFVPGAPGAPGAPGTPSLG